MTGHSTQSPVRLARCGGNRGLPAAEGRGGFCFPRRTEHARGARPAAASPALGRRGPAGVTAPRRPEGRGERRGRRGEARRGVHPVCLLGRGARARPHAASLPSGAGAACSTAGNGLGGYGEEGRPRRHRLTATARALPPLAFERRAVRTTCRWGGHRAGRSQRGRRAGAYGGGAPSEPSPAQPWGRLVGAQRRWSGQTAEPVSGGGGGAAGGGGRRAEQSGGGWGRAGWRQAVALRLGGASSAGSRLRGAGASPHLGREGSRGSPGAAPARSAAFSLPRLPAGLLPQQVRRGGRLSGADVPPSVRPPAAAPCLPRGAAGRGAGPALAASTSPEGERGGSVISVPEA